MSIATAVRSDESALSTRLTVLISHPYPIVRAGLASTLRSEGEWDVRVLDQGPSGTQLGLDVNGVHIVIGDTHGGPSLLGPAPAHRTTNGPRLIVMTTPGEPSPGLPAMMTDIDGCLPVGCGKEELLETLRRVGRGVLRSGGDKSLRPASEPRFVPQGHGARTAATTVPRGGLAPGALRRVVAYMHAHLADSVGLDCLADLAGLSESHFARAFRESTGVPPHRYIVRLRVQAAAQMIQNTNKALAEISLEVGFADQSHLTRQFVRLLGERPREYRHRHR